MSARACTECGAAADEAADQCEICGASLEARKLHEGSDVRIEPERIDAALSKNLLPAGRWGRASDYPATANFASDAGEELAVEAVALAPEPATKPAALLSAVPSVASSTDLPNTSATDTSVTGRLAAAPRAITPDARTATGSTDSQAIPPRRPPVLASEALLRDLAPARPARIALRLWCPLLGTLGAGIVWWLTKGLGMGWPLAGAFSGLALLGLPPMPYQGRASAVVTVAGTGLALVVWADATTPEGVPTIVLTFSVCALATGLYLRAWHRASMVARLIVLVGTLTGAAFLWMSGDLSDLTVFDTAWQSWVPGLVGLSFGMLLMLSLLAFMDARSTGGAAVWATFVLCWQGMRSAIDILHAAWPKAVDSPDIARIPINSLLAWISTPLLSALFALGLSQLMAAGMADIIRRSAGGTFQQDGPRSNHGLAPVK